MSNDPTTARPSGQAPRPLNVLGERITVLLSADQTGGYELFRQQGEAGQGPPPHSHGWDESFYVVSGEVEFGVGGQTQRVGEGGVAHVPADAVHWFRFLGDGEMISVTSRRGASALFTALDAVAAGSSGPPPMDRIVSVILANGAKLAEPAVA